MSHAIDGQLIPEKYAIRRINNNSFIVIDKTTKELWDVSENDLKYFLKKELSDEVKGNLKPFIIKTEDNKTEDNKTEDNKTEDNKTEDNKIEENKIEDIKPEDIKPEVITNERERFICSCGVTVLKSNKTRHMKTEKHLLRLKNTV